MSEGGHFPSKLQRIRQSGPATDSTGNRNPLPDPPKGMVWCQNQETKEWRIVPEGEAFLDEEAPGMLVDGGTGRRWKLAGAFLLMIVIVVGVVLGIILSKESEPSPLSDLLSSLSSDGGKALRTNSTPQNMAFNWLAVNNTNLGNYTRETIIQRYALAALYFSTNGDSWEKNTFWVSNEDACGTPWYGINCTDTGALVELVLRGNSLAGNIPPEIGLLSSLEKLWLLNNTLVSTIPTEIGELTQLTFLSLRNNKLTGTIPSELNSLTNLDYLRLYNNMFTGNFTCPNFIDTCLV